MSPFDTARTTSHLTLTERNYLRLSCTVFEIWWVICRKSPILTHPTCIRRPRRGWPWWNFVEIFGIRKLESLDYRVVLCDPVFSCFSRTPTCDRDRRTQGNSIYRASTATHVKTSVDLNEARYDGVLGRSGISWTICKQSAHRSRQITTPTRHHSIFTAGCSSWRPT